MILQNDFQSQWRIVEESAVGAVRRVGRSGQYVLGREVATFEGAIARFWGMAHAIGVANGMDALEIGLRCLNLKPGDKVLTTPLSAFATTLAIIRAGGKPVFVDVNEFGQIDLKLCREVLKQDDLIRFLVPVHLYGFALDLEEMLLLKQDFGLAIVEDCAQAIGASYRKLRVGTTGQAAATSFYPTKNLGAMGDAGALLTNDDAIAEKARTMRNYGQSAHYVHSELGLNSRLDEIHAAVLSDAFLPNLGKWTEARRRTAGKYQRLIRHEFIKLLTPDATMDPAWHLFPIMVAAESRTQFRAHLYSRGIVTGVHYPDIISDQPALAPVGSCQNAVEPAQARRFSKCEVSLPIHPFLTDQQVSAVINACNDWQP